MSPIMKYMVEGDCSRHWFVQQRFEPVNGRITFYQTSEARITILEFATAYNQHILFSQKKEKI